MVKLKKEAIILFLTFVYLLSFSSAEILVSQLEQIYNAGDELNVSFVLKPSQDKSDFFVGKLNCGSNIFEIYRATYTLSANQDKEISVSATLGNFLIGSYAGKCYLTGQFGNEERSTPEFEIMRDIQVSLNLPSSVFSPGETIKVFGEAKKNGKELKRGYLEIVIPSFNFSFIDSVTDGKFNFSFILPADAPSGNHKISVRVYEKDNTDATLNEGEINQTIKIKQVVKNVVIALSAEEITPGGGLTFEISVYDQAKENVNTNVALVIYAPNQTFFEKKLVQSDLSNTFQTKTNYAPGYWKIEADAEGILSTNNFLVKEYEDASFTLKNQILTVANVGNVPYKKQVEISFGNVKEIKKIELALGETKKYKIAAPDGNYSIVANDGSKSEELGTVFLTGRAISIDEMENAAGGNLFVIISFILILLIGILVIYFFRKILRERALRGKRNTLFNSSLKKLSFPEAKKTLRTAMPSESIEKGEKQESSIISLNIKNAEAISQSKEALDAVDSAMWKAKAEGGKVYAENDFKIVVFAPILTAQQDNTIKAIRTAQTIQKILEDYNKRHAQKILFGIGVNVGEFIVESKEGKFKFTSLNNAVGSTKKLARLASEDVVLSEKIRTKTAGKIKVEKMPNSNLFKLEKVIGRSAHEEFIKRFSERQNKR